MLKILLSMLGILVFANNLNATDISKDKYKMFPVAKEGYERYIVDVPKTDNDYDHKVELLIGKNIMVDCNGASLSANIEKVSLEGWGYSYYEVSNIERGPTTMMACIKPKVEKFISIYNPEKTILRYNSRLGTVIYVPKGYKVRYRIWSAGKDVKSAIKQ
ncbi:Proteinase inhibitor I11, ecotin precursor [hydrothermal vent metagenome]|uniref:Proteinase inhibitor I11, ecotin n=1 Tax=hydrothermal vent metagenome TaxID=652676 RepID=A0A1W1EC83_9ZZZZ